MVNKDIHMTTVGNEAGKKTAWWSGVSQRSEQQQGKPKSRRRLRSTWPQEGREYECECEFEL